MELPRFDPALAERLRSEANEMVRAYVDTLLEGPAVSPIVGIYLKGSTCKPWDSLIDYVPVLSDVDIHVRYRNDDGAKVHPGTLEGSIGVAERALTRFMTRVPNASHLPRPQVLVLNDLERLPGYLPSPAPTVLTVYGAGYPVVSRSDYHDTRTSDAQRFAADVQFVREELPAKIIDRPGAHAWRMIAHLVWRVGPTGPRLLTHLGMHPYDAWSANRTTIVRELIARGCGEAARAYADFYLLGWEGVRSEFNDGMAAHAALHTVDRLFALAEQIIGRQ